MKDTLRSLGKSLETFWKEVGKVITKDFPKTYCNFQVEKREMKQEELLKKVFDKALADSGEVSANGLAQHIHNELQQKCNQPTTADAIRGYHRKLERNEPFNISKTAKNHLAIYLGHENFQAYVKSKKKGEVNSKRHLYLIVLLLGVLSFFTYDSFRKKCMIWENDRYVKIHCEEANAKPIKSDLLRNFTKLEAECRLDFFFNEDESPKIWYYKRGEKDLELFSSPGAHPIRGNDLRKINLDMIRKHICDL